MENQVIINKTAHIPGRWIGNSSPDAGILARLLSYGLMGQQGTQGLEEDNENCRSPLLPSLLREGSRAQG